ncbi:MAG: hypothetical protein WCP55_23905, partial [Lentisphaerota bacterium]
MSRAVILGRHLIGLTLSSQSSGGTGPAGQEGRNSEYPIANTEYPMSKLRFFWIQFRWILEIECWILGVQT